MELNVADLSQYFVTTTETTDDIRLHIIITACFMDVIPLFFFAAEKMLILHFREIQVLKIESLILSKFYYLNTSILNAADEFEQKR